MPAPQGKEIRMPDLPRKKVGIVSCSGEELAEGTVTRLAALQVLEKMRPADTVTICLPLFLAGGEGDRAFARFYPTIAVDGCELGCARRATELYSSKPAASIMVGDVVAKNGIGKVENPRRLNTAGLQAVDATAQELAGLVDELLGKAWDRRAGSFVALGDIQQPDGETNAIDKVATCSCGSGIPVQQVQVNGREVTLIALPDIFQQFRQAGKQPSEEFGRELLETVRIYNPIPAGEEGQYQAALLQEYTTFCKQGMPE
jgi:uncharacterized metal-binding protein